MTRIVTEEEFLDDFRPMEENKDEENRNAAANGAAATDANWGKRAEKELENGIREPPVARGT